MAVLGEDVTYEDAFKASNDVLNGAVAGIAEVINCPGMVNVDFADVRTVMSENGVAMMWLGHGERAGTGADGGRAGGRTRRCSRTSNLSGARGVLVNITASHTHEV